MKGLLIFIFIVLVFGILVVVIVPFLFGIRPQSGTDRGGTRGIFIQESDGPWEKVASEGRQNINTLKMRGLFFHPTSKDTLFAGTELAGLWRSEDGGRTWQKIKDARGVLKENAGVFSLAFFPGNPQEFYVAVFQDNRGRLLKTKDGGASFEEVYFAPVERFGVFDVTVTPLGSIFIITGQGGLLESKTRGASWRIVRWFEDGLTRLVVDPRDSKRMYLLSAKGNIFKSSDGGTAWIDVGRGLGNFDKSSRDQVLVIDRDGILFLGSGFGLLRSRDGITWEQPPIIIPPESLPVRAIASDPQNPSHLFVAAASELYETKDGGRTWEIKAGPSGRTISHIFISPHAPYQMFVITY